MASKISFSNQTFHSLSVKPDANLNSKSIAKNLTALTLVLVVSVVSSHSAHAQLSQYKNSHGKNQSANPLAPSLSDDSGTDDLGETIMANAGDSTSSEDDLHYDDIVKSLQTQDQHDQEASQRLAVKKSKINSDPFADVWMHGGFGWATSFQSLTDARGRALQLNQKGIQATLGIDLFSPNWEAEGSARSMGDESSRGDSVSLKEFDLKILYKNRLNNLARYRLGGGLSGRYMSLHTDGVGTENFTTPAAVATFGLDFFFNRQFSVGADTSLRSSLIADTVDRTSIDAVVRVDAHF